jgi:hypothetical protein
MTAEKVRAREAKIIGNLAPRIDLFTGERLDFVTAR